MAIACDTCTMPTELASRRSTARPGHVDCRATSKLADIAAKVPDCCARHLEGVPAARIEFEFSREALRQFSVVTPAELLAPTGDLWACATGEPLSWRTPTRDTNRSRWPLAPEWEFFQRASLFGARVSPSSGSEPGARPARCGGSCRRSPATSSALPSCSGPTNSARPSRRCFTTCASTSG